MSTEIQAWFAGRLPDEWFTEPAEVIVDREEITIVGTLSAPEAGAAQGGEGGVPADAPLQNTTTRTDSFERSTSLDFTFPPHTTTILELKLVTKGVPYWSRPDLGLDREDVKVEGNRMKVTVHSLGSVDAPASKVVLRDKAGKVLASASVPSIKAPIDLFPKTASVVLMLPAGAELKGGSVTVESSGKLPEITQMNNRVPL